MLHSLPVRLRGTELGPDRWITLPAVMRVFEQARWVWMEEPELGLMEALHEGFGFYIARQSLHMNRRFGMGGRAVVRSTLTRVGRSSVDVAQELVRDDGVQLAHTHMVAAWVHPGGRLARIPGELREVGCHSIEPGPLGEPRHGSERSLYDVPEPLRPPGGLELPGEPPGSGIEWPVRVRASDLDVFDHVNAANYLRFVGDALAARGLSSSLYGARMRYHGQARRGDALVVQTETVGEHVHHAWVRRDGEVLYRAAVETESAGSTRGLW
jgi:acyl-CoA thioesterase FadM